MTSNCPWGNGLRIWRVTRVLFIPRVSYESTKGTNSCSTTLPHREGNLRNKFYTNPPGQCGKGQNILSKLKQWTFKGSWCDDWLLNLHTFSSVPNPLISIVNAFLSIKSRRWSILEYNRNRLSTSIKTPACLTMVK